MMRPLVSSLVLLSLLLPLPAFAQASAPPQGAAAAPSQVAPETKPAAPAGRISGYVFGDYYYFASSHDPRFESQNGFWLRRESYRESRRAS